MYTMLKDRETFTVTTKSQSLAVVKFNIFVKKGYPLEAGITPITENCRVYMFSGSDLLVSAN